MSKKTATKKKPTTPDPLKGIRAQLRSIESKVNVCMNRTEELNRSLDGHWSKREQHNDWLQPKIMDIKRALESRSAPAEEWVPKVGDWVMKSAGWGSDNMRRWPEDAPRKVTDVFERHGTCKIDGIEIVGSWGYTKEFDRVRPATPAEIADHKAKEEQRVREEEREKELAKVPEFGTRVKWGSYTGRVACEGPDHENQYLVAYKPGNGSVWHSTWVRRRDLTIID